MQENPFHFTRKPRPLCKKTPYTLQENPVHFARKPRLLFKKTPYTLLENPVHFLRKPPALSHNLFLSNSRLRPQEAKLTILRRCMQQLTTTTNKNPRLTFHRRDGTRGIKFGTQTKLTCRWFPQFKFTLHGLQIDLKSVVFVKLQVQI